MDLKKLIGNQKSGGATPLPNGSNPQAKLKNIQESEAWQKSQAGIKKAWHSYKETLGVAWQRLPRKDQEAIITRACQIITIGVCVLALMFFYGFLPPLIRLLAVPILGVGSFWAGTKIVAPIVIVQYDQFLNKEF